jgi:hypothetical protein
MKSDNVVVRELLHQVSLGQQLHQLFVFDSIHTNSLNRNKITAVAVKRLKTLDKQHLSKTKPCVTGNKL